MKIIISAFLAIILASVLLSQIRIEDISKLITKFSIPYALGAFFMWSATYFFRTVRFQVLICSKRIEIKNLFPIISVHNFFINILPIRMGEISYIYILKKNQNVKISEGMATLLIARVCDSLIMSIFFFISLMIMRERLIISLSNVIYIVIAFVLIVVIFLLYMPSLGTKSIKIFEFLFQKLKIENYEIFKLFIMKGQEIINNIHQIQSYGTFPFTILLTVAIWVTIYLTSYLWLIGIKLYLDIWTVIFITTFPGIIATLPIQGLAGIGTVEVGWVAALMMLGITKEQAIILGFCFHFLALVYTSILGLYGVVAIRYKNVEKLSK